MPLKKLSSNKPSRADSKQALVLAMLHRKQGITIAAVMQATGWHAGSMPPFADIAQLIAGPNALAAHEYGGGIDHKLQDLATRTERAMASSVLSTKDGKSRPGRAKAATPDAFLPKLYCAALIAETWAYFPRSDPPPGNRHAAGAAHAFWRASGGETKGWGDDPLNRWRYYFEQVREPNLDSPMTQSALQEVAMDGSSVPHFALGSGKAPAKHGRYFEDRNVNFQQHPKRAGKKTWGNEREPAAFSDANTVRIRVIDSWRGKW